MKDYPGQAAPVPRSGPNEPGPRFPSHQVIGTVIPRLGCLFIIVPLLELALLIQVGRWVGVVPTVLLVALTGVLGLVLVRQEGTRTVIRIQTEIGQGRLPHRALMDGACLLVGGAFLMTPGVLTDILAFALLVGPTRKLLQDWALRRLRRAMETGAIHVQMYGAPPPGGMGQQGPPTEPGSRADRDEDDPDSPPPRPGEIIQD